MASNKTDDIFNHCLVLPRAKSAISLGISVLIVIALIITVGFGVYLNDTINTTSTTNTSTVSSSSSNVSASPTITTSTTVSNSGLYLLLFNQTSLCGPDTGLYGYYFLPWSVTLTSGSYEITKAQPPSANSSLDGTGSPSYKQYSLISFSVPNGTYNYTINPTNDFENSQTGSSSGTITINGNSVIVYVRYNLASCGPTITTTTTTKTSTSPASQSSIVLDLSNGSAACQNIREGQEFIANWSGNVCSLTGSDNISNFALKQDVTLEVFPGVTLVLNGGGFANYGTIINNGTMEVQTSFGSYGVIVNSGLISTNSTIVTVVDTYFMPNGGTFENYGSFLINGRVGYYQHNETYSNGTTYITAGDENLTGGTFANGGILDNYGTINNTGWFWNSETGLNFNSTINNFGTIRNLEYARFVNNYTINNYGTIVNSGNLANGGTIVTFCGSSFVEAGGGTYSGSAVIGACSTISFQTTTTKEEKYST